MKTFFALGLLVGGTLAPAAIAQTAPTEAQKALEELQQKNRDLSAGQGGMNFMQLMHNANFSDSRSPDRISREQDEAIESAVARFRQQQRQQLPTPAIARPQS
ncbi:MAG: hypothetical protein HC918_10190 [Oscillatoriales cyanobacterium SM2_1_8]|nr:hypothetical protein [Oscillatoriales cyanobacterium SM2_1_8]